MGYDPTYSRLMAAVEDTRPLPGVRHGSVEAGLAGCACPKCLERRKKARKRGMRL